MVTGRLGSKYEFAAFYAKVRTAGLCCHSFMTIQCPHLRFLVFAVAQIVVSQ